MDCRGYGTTSLRGIPLATQYGNASLSKAHAFVESDNSSNVKHFAQPDLCQGEGFEEA